MSFVNDYYSLETDLLCLGLIFSSVRLVILLVILEVWLKLGAVRRFEYVLQYYRLSSNHWSIRERDSCS